MMVSAQGSTCQHVDQHLSAGKKDPFKKSLSKRFIQKVYLQSHTVLDLYLYI